MVRTVVIDDETLALRQLSAYVGRVAELELVGVFRSAIDADNFFREKGCVVDLILCDINMPEMSGVEFIRSLQMRCSESGEVAPMVIFTTAYSEYAIEGFRLDAVDYLLKPFSFADFERSAKRAHSLYELRYGRTLSTDEEMEDATVDESVDDNQAEYLPVKADYKVRMIKISEIIYIESEGEYVRIHLEGARPITTLFRLKNMESCLPASQFVRTHRSYIVNIDRVYSYEKSRVFISRTEYLPIGQNFRQAFINAISSRSATL